MLWWRFYKKIGLYGEVIDELKKENLEIFELNGIEPNPRVTSVNTGANICKKEKIDVLLAVGGGSVIDCSKAISVSAYCDGDAWEKYWINFEEVNNKIVPVGSILTMAGTGSEMNGGSVITHEEKMLKNGRVFFS